MENKEVAIRKIPLDNFIDVLMDLYNKGVDFVDIIGVQGDDMDRMAISFSEDYMMEGAQANFKDIPQEDLFTNGKLSDEDLNQLI